MKKNMSGGKMVAVGAGLAAAGAGAYYLMGPNAKAHQKKAKALMVKMRRDVKGKVAKAKIMTKPLYDNAVDSLLVSYSKQHKNHEKDLKMFADMLKGEWQGAAKSAVKKSVKMMKKKVAKKTSKTSKRKK